ncbi:peptidoglycan/xylan/chitin deacetylase (PgdA/CDA1 family) [Nocardioides thalensis]|uniref:Peptidoglycan/xylan/chitin deacetylase (PgdA/CDA1 family) n=1 Tax=Nocardioides thalensis TaxID=1914755 RepID=A0A853C5H2_9ACTN|nr:polysaccharide deacetylase [Nocardioides thalensis]NYJ03330.1 peptidoglycan/xylan/chitin deacetylase (PgdA/CDA1 family) [Nocardioides thalensis]
MDVDSDAWRRGAAAVATLTFDVDAETPVLASSGRYARHLTTMSHQAYGPDVGVPRILDLLDRLEVPATFFLPGWVAERRPHLAASIVDRGHEVAHHSYSHRSATEMTPDAQRQDFERGLAVFEEQGIDVVGHRAALWHTTTTTMELLAEHRMAYDSSMMGDDRPYLLQLDGASVVELPVHWSLDDWEQYAFLPEPHVGSIIEAPSKVFDMWRDELDAMTEHGCLFNLCLHPFLSARPGRLAVVRRLVEWARERGDITFERCRDVAARVAEVGGVREVRVGETEIDPETYPD